MEGARDGDPVVGAVDGCDAEGFNVGSIVGSVVGYGDGPAVGDAVGDIVGAVGVVMGVLRAHCASEGSPMVLAIACELLARLMRWNIVFY